MSRQEYVALEAFMHPKSGARIGLMERVEMGDADARALMVSGVLAPIDADGQTVPRPSPRQAITSEGWSVERVLMQTDEALLAYVRREHPDVVRLTEYLRKADSQARPVITAALGMALDYATAQRARKKTAA